MTVVIGNNEFDDHKIPMAQKVDILMQAVFGKTRNNVVEKRGIMHTIDGEWEINKEGKLINRAEGFRQIIIKMSEALSRLSIVMYGQKQKIKDKDGKDTVNSIDIPGAVGKINELTAEVETLRTVVLCVARSAKLKPEKLADMMFDKFGGYEWHQKFNHALEERIKKAEAEKIKQNKEIKKEEAKPEEVVKQEIKISEN